ncbi:hypothetical protein N658DRAFT_501566 [Parathielavia hyrcaniae]|uniref:Aminoglycoside phosphotransferase domain-containing protein n=1 Tax=Parathielavia hyrcaniae TaxID=113614 RepID=A0AAN6SXI4_9PEZI|nr:hypothetical protein N658DRAFT_501566 [Parathielavia hyrcaniae]
MTAVAPQTLPYFCDASELPGPLPSLSEIEAADHTLPGIYDRRYQRIVAVRERFVVKYGVAPWVFENEGHALLLLQKHPSIPVPRLYAMYRKDKRLFLVMELKEGVQRSTVWDGLSEDDKIGIIGQLHDILARVRQIPSPGLFGNVAGGPLRHRFFLSKKPAPELNGSFHHEKDFSMAMAIRSRRNHEENGYKPCISEFWERHLPTALAGHPSALTHGDLQRKNILVSMGTAAVPGGAERQGKTNSKGNGESRLS